MPSLSTLLPPFFSTLSVAPPQTVRLINISLPLLVLSERFSFYPGSYIFKLLSSAAFVGGPLYYLAPSSPLQWRQWDPYHLRIAAGLVFSMIGDYCLIPTRTEYYDKHIGPLIPKKQAEEEEEEEEEEEAVAGEGEDEPTKISTSFRAGVGAFAAAHVAYILAFLKNSSNQSSNGSTVSWPIFTSTFVVSMLLSKWLGVIYPPKGKKKETKSSNAGTTNTGSLSSSNVLNLAISDDMRPLVFGYSAIISGMLAVAASTTAAIGAAVPPHQRLLGAAMFVASDIFVAKDAFGKRRAGNPGWVKPAVGFGLYFWAQMLIAGTVTGE
ncbi:hypothetical protein AJ78_06713 [Emergomyces pasteurianus Ep9510]|uniref:YhhN domain-containing protein n=1 Tax=Emergomyces pasteurianus Ep9510 TaxID=1447872 RepID=A0A1J9Q980_9EURO|nr:hypothetical protein AJ78_06713 [Emergomyces pasteurianus Ep9510]